MDALYYLNRYIGLNYFYADVRTTKFKVICSFNKIINLIVPINFYKV